ncbi:hypothetical protein DAPPUDRAFT_119216 [Daphnia pulex]|uniref:Uncharacterized protein n=1 Tax=Daphnia pulex TaxID=6669 RepID=E9HXU7_DAPPU|nr:hypothetical protein DAPPUDRAFT_119216 [Daphnia pulex]|eukprot:EFX63432.1 hypothetical protein DAPPUDRAFT_119216 [Daphnia pulex]
MGHKSLNYLNEDPLAGGNGTPTHPPQEPPAKRAKREELGPTGPRWRKQLLDGATWPWERSGALSVLATIKAHRDLALILGDTGPATMEQRPAMGAEETLIAPKARKEATTARKEATTARKVATPASTTIGSVTSKAGVRETPASIPTTVATSVFAISS